MVDVNRNLPVEPKITQRAIDSLDKLFSKLMLGSKSEKTIGDGTVRARQRLAAKRKANAEIPSGYRMTRQQRRREQILRGRQIMTIAKKEAAQRGIKGGSARIRNPVDVDQVLG